LHEVLNRKLTIHHHTWLPCTCYSPIAHKAMVHFLLCILVMLPSLNFPVNRNFFLKNPLNLVWPFWLLKVTVLPIEKLIEAKSYYPSFCFILKFCFFKNNRFFTHVNVLYRGPSRCPTSRGLVDLKFPIQTVPNENYKDQLSLPSPDSPGFFTGQNFHQLADFFRPVYWNQCFWRFLILKCQKVL
jgi:hypothetical protein